MSTCTDRVVVHVIGRPSSDGVPMLGWYPRAYYRAQFLPDSLLDKWVASGDVRMKKADPNVQQSTAFFRLSDVVEMLESLADVAPKEQTDSARRAQNLISAEVQGRENVVCP